MVLVLQKLMTSREIIGIASQRTTISDNIVMNMVAANWFPPLFRIDQPSLGRTIKPRYYLIENALYTS